MTLRRWALPLRQATRHYWLVLPPVLVLAILFFIPLFMMLAFSFFQVEAFQVVPTFTTDNYLNAVTAPLDRQILLGTVWVSVICVVFSLLLGYPVAYFLARRVRNRRHQQLLLVLAIMPLWTSYLIRTFAWIPILSRDGVINQFLLGAGIINEPLTWLLYSQFAVVVGLVGVYVPYMILPCYAVLGSLDNSLFEAAEDLGASRAQRTLYVLLPLSAPGIVVGCVFVFILAMGAYVTPTLLGGTNGTMIGNQIGNQFLRLYNFPLGSAMSLILMSIIVLLAVAGLRRYGASEAYGR